jgi:hypothetical protein
MFLYDLVIERAIPMRNVPKLDGIEYCAGWTDYTNMGVAALCVRDFDRGRSRVFDAHNREQFFDLVNTTNTVWIGYNNARFADRIIEDAWNYKMDPRRRYDILEEIWRANGLVPEKFDASTHCGFGLREVSYQNLRIAKKDIEAERPIDWQSGKRAQVIDACFRDLWLTKGLLELILTTHELAHPVSGRVFEVCTPDERMRYMRLAEEMR